MGSDAAHRRHCRCCARLQQAAGSPAVVLGPVREEWPQVTPRARRGFGSRLLEDGLSRDLEGQTRLEFAAEGLRCSISASLSADS